MGRTDVKSRNQLAVLLATAAVTAAQTIQGDDVSDFRGVAFCVDVGAHTADGNTVVFQHRDAGGDWEDIPDGDLDGNNNIAIVAGHADSQVYVGYTGNKQEIGAKIDSASGSAVVGVYVLKGGASQFPVND